MHSLVRGPVCGCAYVRMVRCGWFVVNTWRNLHEQTFVCVCVCVCVCVYVCFVCVFACVRACMHVHVCVLPA